jgi:hypothetical protein
VGGLWNAFGLFTSFITLNPPPLTCAPFFTMAGKPYSFDANGKPFGRPDMVDRWRTVAENPVRAAIMFNIQMEAFREVFLGWPPGAREQADPNCIFGQVLAHFSKYETTGRADLHCHGNIVQPDLQPARMLQLARDQPEQLARFLEAIMCREVTDVPTQLQVDRNADPKPAAYRVPLHDDAASNMQRVCAMLGNCQLDVQHHHHTTTCAKNGGAANDMGCRVTMPRCTVPATSVIAHVVKCNNAHVAPHIPALLLAQPMNQAVWASCEASSSLRDHYIWALAKAHNLTDAPPPPLMSAARNAAEKAEYATKYSTKPDNVNLATPTAQLALRILERSHNFAATKAAAAGEVPVALAANVGLSTGRCLYTTDVHDIVASCPQQAVECNVGP